RSTRDWSSDVCSSDLDGVLTEKLAAMGCQVVGVDGSSEQITAAIARGLDARTMDAQQLTFENEFDAVFSNAALHWMKRPDGVIRSEEHTSELQSRVDL